jgi:hypothetical protein
MKHLPWITLLLWGLMIAGYILLPQVVLRDVVQYPLVVLLSILLPIGVWLSAQDGRKLGAMALAGVFVVNVTLLVFVLERNYSSWKNLERAAGKGVVPAIVGLLAGEKDATKSRIAARYIYHHHSIKVPYKTGDEGFAVYVPSEQDKKIFRQQFSQGVEIDVARMNGESQLLTTFLLLALHVGIFVLLLLFLLLYEQQAHPSPVRTADPS